MKSVLQLVALLMVPGVWSGAAHGQAQIDFGGVQYTKLETRRATEERMFNLLQGRPDVRWGEWYLATPFPGREKGVLAVPHPPEADLAKMTPGGPGPDLGASYAGKNGVRVAWRPIGHVEGRSINMLVHDDPALNNQGTAYLYRTVTAEKASGLDVQMGSDDGLRFWLNGRLLIDADVPRGLNVEDHALTLPLEAGVNHILCKVTQGAGGWEYQLNTHIPLDAVTDAKLLHLLDRDFPSAEDAHYRVATVPVPEGIVLEVGGLDVTTDGRAAVCTRRGDVYLVSGITDDPPLNARFSLFASGLHEPLGLAVRDDGIYCVQRAELTRLRDDDGDGAADAYETVCDAWGVSGNYHEFAFGPKFDRDGNAWITLNVGFCGSLGKSVAPYRGWAVKVTPDGAMIPVCDGLRSPNGIGMDAAGSMFYVDNQGDYVGTNKLSPLDTGLYLGHPAGLRWREDGSSEKDPPPRHPTAVWFPYKKMGQSAADILLDTTGGRFGPFEGQLFVGDQTLASVMRVYLEEVGGVHQGACFPFRSGLDCGVNRLAWDKEGGMLVGQTDRGWGSVGRRRYGLQRIIWTGETPFEVLRMNAASDGFTLTFTDDVDPASAADPASYRMASYTYEYHPEYGSAEMDRAEPVIVRAEVSGPRTVRLIVDGMRSGGEGYVHELVMPGVKDREGNGLLHTEAYYTVQRLPEGVARAGR